MCNIFFNKAFILVKLPYLVDEIFSAGTLVPLFRNFVFEKEATKKTPQFFPRKVNRCFVLAKLYRFGWDDCFPEVTAIDFQKAIYWHLQALYFWGENWQEEFDKVFLSKSYREVLSEFLKNELREYVQHKQID